MILISGCLLLSIVMMLLAQLNNMHTRSKCQENEGQEKPSDAVVVQEKTIVQQVIQCFSVVDNFNMICSTRKSPNAIPVVDGLK